MDLFALATATQFLHSVDGVRPDDEAEGRIQNSPMGSPGSFAVASAPELELGHTPATPVDAAVLGTPKGSNSNPQTPALEGNAGDRP